LIFWEGSIDIIIDVRLTNLDSKSRRNLPLVAQKGFGTTREREDKEILQAQRELMSPFHTCVASTNGMNGFEARALLKRLAKFLAEEWEKHYPTGKGFISTRMSIDLVKTTRGSRIPASYMSNRFRWEGGAGLGLRKSNH